MCGDSCKYETDLFVIVYSPINVFLLSYILLQSYILTPIVNLLF